ncbi:hypothetical protein FISHEDRAFT_62832 [Fistulina hepatica ATCC 64428]|uniref:Uncharacterized protein n=1 Tax=Fistulina hepatica ATCC 64428 TaxID=1128425 RepID=A0A0D7A2L6_9AGAR|nr:hypothetical protein FISHEDRAFT_62832 [Fistulina hepatica ATCC 64428]
MDPSLGLALSFSADVADCMLLSLNSAWRDKTEGGGKIEEAAPEHQCNAQQEDTRQGERATWLLASVYDRTNDGHDKTRQREVEAMPEWLEWLWALCGEGVQALAEGCKQSG